MTNPLNTITTFFKSRRNSGIAMAIIAVVAIAALSSEDDGVTMQAGSDAYGDIYASAPAMPNAPQSGGYGAPTVQSGQFQGQYNAPAPAQTSMQPSAGMSQSQPVQYGQPNTMNPQQQLIGAWAIQDQRHGGQIMVQFGPDGSYVMVMQNRMGTMQTFGKYQIVGTQNGVIQVRMAQTAPKKMKPTMNGFAISPDGYSINYDGMPGYRMQ